MACRSLEHYPQSKIYQQCRTFQNYRDNQVEKAYKFLRHNTFKRTVDYFNKFYEYIIGIKDSIFHFIDDRYYYTKRFIVRQYDNIRRSIKGLFSSTTESAKEYCDASLQKVNDLIEDFKREKERYLGSRHAFKPAQEQELEAVS